MTFFCDDRLEPVEDPKPGCRCEGCVFEREARIPPEIAAIVRDAQFPRPVSLSAIVVQRVISAYLAGHDDGKSLEVELIRALAQQLDEKFGQLLDMSKTNLSVHSFKRDLP